MTHLSDDMLNGYLDEALSAQECAVVEAHLTVCTACARQFSALRAVFSELDALPELALAGDLAPAVLAAALTRLERPARLPGLLRRLAVFQTAAVLAAALWAAWSTAMVSWPLMKVSLPFEFPALAEWAAVWSGTWSTWMEALASLHFSFLAVPPFDRSSAMLAIFAFCVLAAAWLVGNGLLLLPRSRRHL